MYLVKIIMHAHRALYVGSFQLHSVCVVVCLSAVGIISMIENSQMRNVINSHIDYMEQLRSVYSRECKLVVGTNNENSMPAI